MEVALIWCEKIKGSHSRPTCTDEACRNGPLLNAGSSLMEMLSARAPPLRIEAESLPTWTVRPSATESFVSSSGRKLSTLMNNGTSSTARTMMPITTPPTISQRFMTKMLSAIDDGNKGNHDVFPLVGRKGEETRRDVSASKSRKRCTARR